MSHFFPIIIPLNFCCLQCPLADFIYLLYIFHHFCVDIQLCLLPYTGGGSHYKDFWVKLRLAHWPHASLYNGFPVPIVQKNFLWILEIHLNTNARATVRTKKSDPLQAVPWHRYFLKRPGGLGHWELPPYKDPNEISDQRFRNSWKDTGHQTGGHLKESPGQTERGAVPGLSAPFLLQTLGREELRSADCSEANENSPLLIIPIMIPVKAVTDNKVPPSKTT